MKTGAEYRHAGKARAKKFREEQEKRGFKSISAFISTPFIDELNRLKNENGMTRNEALNHIFETYLSVTCNVSRKTTNNVKTDIQWPNKQAEIQFKNEAKPEPGSPEHIALLDNFILDRHKKGGRGGTLTLKQIADALNEAGIMSATGKTEWKSGGVDSACKAALRRLKKD